MNNLLLSSSPSQRPVAGQCGMTLLEALVAMIMLVVFTGVVALVLQFTLRFFSVAESGEQNEDEVSNGVLIDHQQIQIAMDDLVEVLSQPGITLDRLKGEERCDPTFSSCVACTDKPEESCRPQIAFDLGTDPQDACPAARPVSHWGLPMSEVSLPPGYRLCLWKTPVRVVEKTTGFVSTEGDESPIAELLEGGGAKPGLYLLQALPEQLSSTSLPTRRLFCRPRPFC